MWIKHGYLFGMPHDPPNTIPWPPLIYLGAAAIALFLHGQWPIAWPQANTTLALIGVFLLVVAIAIEVFAAFTFRKCRTTILPHRAASVLITSGPFAFSRNPIYVANTLLLAGAGFAFGIGWLLIMAPMAALATQELAIKREEQHLAEKFGSAWASYAARTSRWIGGTRTM